MSAFFLILNVANKAIAYTISTLKGGLIRLKGQPKYIGRDRKVKQTDTKNSHFWRLIMWQYLDNFLGKSEKLGRMVNEN